MPIIWHNVKCFPCNGRSPFAPPPSLAISAPSVFTELGLFVRYQEEINFQGWGRLAVIESHNKAVKGLPKTLDLLYEEKAVSKIHLYTYQAKKHIESYILENDKWCISVKPSIYVNETRKLQLQNDKKRLQTIINLGKITYKDISTNLKKEVEKSLIKIEKILAGLEKK